MFTKARMTLTAWYLLIIMLISISFSMVIYRMLSMELERFERMQRTRIERRFQETIREQSFISPPDPELIVETKQRLIFFFIMINGAIIFVAGGLGYILAGITLKPIADMVDEQHRFISDASHELRTPLTAMKTSLEVELRNKKLTVQGAKKTITGTIEQINSLQYLSDKLLKLTNNVSVMTTIDMYSSIQQAIHQMLPIAKQKHIVIHEHLIHEHIHGNGQDLTDLFVIFLDNAIKYSKPESPVTITMEKHDNTIVTNVIDEGIGIAKKDIPFIFNRFYRIDEARTNNQTKGYGLGLAIAKKIVEAHHGTITVESTIRKGSTFQVSFRII